MIPNDSTRLSARRCLSCQLVTDALACPNDRSATYVRGLARVDPKTLTPGTIVAGRYQVSAEIGAGGFGTVFEAADLQRGTTVALKVLGADPDPDDARLLRFLREAQVTTALTHPNTVRVLDFGQDDRGVVFLVMERLHGQSLKEAFFARKQKGRVFADWEAAKIAIEILSSLEEAHAAGLVHRDLKPDNVMLLDTGDGGFGVKVLDFGIARRQESTLTVAAAVPCTPEFASPEQALSAPTDARSDLYTVGVDLFLIVSGELPFKSPVRSDILKMQAFSQTPDLRRFGHCAGAFVDIVERAMAKRADDRFTSASEMKAALRAFVQSARRIVDPASRPSQDVTKHLPAPSADSTLPEQLLPATRIAAHEDLELDATMPATPLFGLEADGLTAPGEPELLDPTPIIATPVVPRRLVIGGRVADGAVDGLEATVLRVPAEGMDPTLIRPDPTPGDFIQWSEVQTAPSSFAGAQTDLDAETVTQPSGTLTPAPVMATPQQPPYVISSAAPLRRTSMAVMLALASFVVGVAVTIAVMDSPEPPPPPASTARQPGRKIVGRAAHPSPQETPPTPTAPVARPPPARETAPVVEPPPPAPVRRPAKTPRTRPKRNVAPAPAPAPAAPDSDPSALDIEI